MVLGKLPVPGRPTIWMIVGQGPTVLAVGAGEGCLDIFTLIYLYSPLSPSLWETVRYRLKYCLKGPLNPKQPTNHMKFSTWMDSKVEKRYIVLICLPNINFGCYGNLKLPLAFIECESYSNLKTTWTLFP